MKSWKFISINFIQYSIAVSSVTPTGSLISYSSMLAKKSTTMYTDSLARLKKTEFVLLRLYND